MHDQAQVAVLGAFKMFVQALLGNVLAGSGQAVLNFAFFLRKGHRRVRQLHVVETGGLVDQVFFGEFGGLVVLGHKLPAHMAGADAQLHHHRHVGRFGQPKTVFDHVDHLAQLRPRVEQAHARLERIGVGAFLNDAGTLAVVFAHHDQHAPGHAGRRQIGQRIGRHVGAHNRLPGHRAANRVMDGCAQHRGGRRFVGTGLHVHAQFVHVGLGLHHHIEQVRDRCALIAAHIAHARLQQPLGDGQNALAVKDLARAHAQGLDFFVK